MKICMVTGSRADYGLLEPIAKLMDKDPDIVFEVLVTGSHCSPKYGFTEDYIPFAFESVPLPCGDDNITALGINISVLIEDFVEYFGHLLTKGQIVEIEVSLELTYRKV